MEPLERVTVMITLIRQLEAVMERENRALKAVDMVVVESLQDEKNLLAEAYEIEMRKIMADPSILGSLDSHVRQTLDEAVRQLQATSSRNEASLAAAKTVIERLVQKLGESMAKSARGGRYGNGAASAHAPGYGAAGVGGQTGGQVIAVAFNHAI